MQKRAKTRCKQAFPLVQVPPIPPKHTAIGSDLQCTCPIHYWPRAHTHFQTPPLITSPTPNPHSNHPRISLTNKLIEQQKRENTKERKKHEILLSYFFFPFFCADFIIIIVTNSEVKRWETKPGWWRWYGMWETISLSFFFCFFFFFSNLIFLGVVV